MRDGVKLTSIDGLEVHHGTWNFSALMCHRNATDHVYAFIQATLSNPEFVDTSH
jgi:hypothetical protein